MFNWLKKSSPSIAQKEEAELQLLATTVKTLGEVLSGQRFPPDPRARQTLLVGLETINELLNLPDSASTLLEPALKIAKVLDIDARNPLLHATMAHLLANDGKIEDALTAALVAANLDPNNSKRYKQLASLYAAQYASPKEPKDMLSRLSEIDLLKIALKIDPSDNRAYEQLMRTYDDFQMHTERLEIAKKYAEVFPKEVDAQNALRSTRLTLEDPKPKEVEKLFDAGNPCNGFTFQLYSEGYAERFDQESVRKLLTRKEQAKNDEDKLSYDFAIGNVLDRQGEYERAYSFFDRANQECNRVYFKNLPFSGSIDLQNIELARQYWIPGVRVPEPLVPLSQSGITPIFVVGLPRSGTSLIEAILSSHQSPNGHSSIISAGEQPHIGKFTDIIAHQAKEKGGVLPALCQELADTYRLALTKQFSLEGRPQVKYVIDKMPFNFHSLFTLAQLFPDSPIIHCKRNLLDSGLSMFQRNFGNGLGARRFISWERIGMYQKRIYQPQIEHFNACLPGRMLEVPYEQLVTNPTQSVAAIVKYCGLPWSDRCMKFNEVNKLAATDRNVRQPIFTSSIGRWKNYAQFMKPLQEQVGDGNY